MAVGNIPLLCDARDQNFSAARRRGGLDYMQPMEVELDKAKLLQGMNVNHTDNFSRCLNLSITYGIWKTRPYLYIFTKERQAIPKIKQLRTRAPKRAFDKAFVSKPILQLDFLPRPSPQATKLPHRF
jgi:hypothetical protein